MTWGPEHLERDPAEESSIDPELVRAFDTLVDSKLQSFTSGAISRAEAERQIWELPERSVLCFYDGYRDMPGVQDESLGILREKAMSVLHEHVIDPERKKELLRRCEGLARKYTFRPWRPSDAVRFVELLDNPRMWTFLPGEYPNPLSQKLALELIQFANAPHHRVMAVECGKEIIGQVRLSFGPSQPDPGDRVGPAFPEVAYWVGEAYWGKGHGTEILTLFTRQTFAGTSYGSIHSWIDEANVGSLRIAQKAGYRPDDWRMSVVRRKSSLTRLAAFRLDYV
jgi:RimJ/RimL family protein N-acetyltransferase